MVQEEVRIFYYALTYKDSYSMRCADGKNMLLNIDGRNSRLLDFNFEYIQDRTIDLLIYLKQNDQPKVKFYYDRTIDGFKLDRLELAKKTDKLSCKIDAKRSNRLDKLLELYRC